MREKARYRKAEEFMTGILRRFEAQHGVPAVLLEPYAVAVERHDLHDRRVGGDDLTAGEAIAQARGYYRQLLEAIAAFTTSGGRDRWRAFQQALADYVPAAGLAVTIAHRALLDAGHDVRAELGDLMESP